jgi:hypothetical protein
VFCGGSLLSLKKEGGRLSASGVERGRLRIALWPAAPIGCTFWGVRSGAFLAQGFVCAAFPCLSQVFLSSLPIGLLLWLRACIARLGGNFEEFLKKYEIFR